MAVQSMSEKDPDLLQLLLALHDEPFVIRAYEIILGRIADPGGLQNYLLQVRQGIHKGQIVAELAESPEGRLKGIDLPGLRGLIKAYRKRPPSIWARLLQRLISRVTEPTGHHLRAIENRLYLLEQAVSAQSKRLADLSTLLQEKACASCNDEPRSSNMRNDATQATANSIPPKVRRTYANLKAAIAYAQRSYR